MNRRLTNPETNKSDSHFFYYGWLIVAISFFNLTVGYGLRASFSVFLVAILDEFGWGRGAISGAFSLHMLVASVGLPVAGALSDRYGPRVIFPIGISIMALGMLLLGDLHEMWQFYMFYGFIMAAGRVMIAMAPHTGVISNWFKTKRGTAMGIAGSGVGFGSVLLVPVVQIMLTRYGWRQGCMLIALVMFVVLVPLNLIFQRVRPADTVPAANDDANGGGRVDLSSMEPETISAEDSEQSWTLERAIRTPTFWLLYGAFFFTGTLMMLDMHQIAYFVDAGFGKYAASVIFSGVGVTMTMGVFFGGALSDKIGRGRAYAIGAFFLILGIVFLSRVKSTSQYYTIITFICCYGLGKGFRLSLLPLLTADVFPGNHVGTIYGTFATGITFGGVLCPWLAGFLHDATGDYTIAFAITLISTVIAAILVRLISASTLLPTSRFRGVNRRH